MREEYGRSLIDVRITEMKTFQFTVILSDLTQVTESAANKLFESGCDDSTFASSEGRAELLFDREAESLEGAVETAIAQVESAGFAVERVESDEFSTIHRFNERLAQV